MKAFLKSKDTYLAAKLAYAHCGDEADPPYQPVLILEPGNVQQSKEESHQNWTDVFKELQPGEILVYWYSDRRVTIQNNETMILHQPGLERKYANLPLTTQLKKDGECTEAEEKVKKGYRQFMEDIAKEENYHKTKVDYFSEDFPHL